MSEAAINRLEADADRHQSWLSDLDKRVDGLEKDLLTKVGELTAQVVELKTTIKVLGSVPTVLLVVFEIWRHLDK